MIVGKKTKKGFTLAELLVVVAIVAVLAAIAIPVFSSSLEKARAAVDMSNYRSMQFICSELTETGTVTVNGLGTLDIDDFVATGHTKDKALYLLKDGSFALSTRGNPPDDAYLAKTDDWEGTGRLKGAQLMIIYSGSTGIEPTDLVNKFDCRWDVGL